MHVPGVGAILGGSRQCERVATSLGHIRRSREGSALRIRQVRFLTRRPRRVRWIDINHEGSRYQVRRRVTMLLHNQSRFPAKLQGDVVPRDQKVLPADTGPAGRMQKRSAVHVSGRDLSQLLPRPQSLRKVSVISSCEVQNLILTMPRSVINF